MQGELDSTYEKTYVPPEQKVWGRMVAVRPSKKCQDVDLQNNQICFGRRGKASVEGAQVEIVGHTESPPVVSGLHCIVQRWPDGVVLLTDHSSNGTSIGAMETKIKDLPNKQSVLNHGDTVME